MQVLINGKVIEFWTWGVDPGKGNDSTVWRALDWHGNTLRLFDEKGYKKEMRKLRRRRRYLRMMERRK